MQKSADFANKNTGYCEPCDITDNMILQKKKRQII